jgi:hypothetical protein
MSLKNPQSISKTIISSFLGLLVTHSEKITKLFGRFTRNPRSKTLSSVRGVVTNVMDSIVRIVETLLKKHIHITVAVPTNDPDLMKWWMFESEDAFN